MPADVAFLEEETEAQEVGGGADAECTRLPKRWYLLSATCQHCHRTCHLDSFIQPSDGSTEVGNIINAM